MALDGDGSAPQQAGETHDRRRALRRSPARAQVVLFLLFGRASLHAILRSASCDCRHCVMARLALTSLHRVSESLLQASFIAILASCLLTWAWARFARRSWH